MLEKAEAAQRVTAAERRVTSVPRQASRPLAARRPLPGDQLKSPWQQYGWLMAVIWLGFLYFPISALLDSPGNPVVLAIGWVALVSFPVCYIWGFVRGMANGWHLPGTVVWVLFAVLVACAMLTVPAIGWDALSFAPFLVAYASYLLGTVWHWLVGLSLLALTLGYSGLCLYWGERLPYTLLAVLAIMLAANTITLRLVGDSISADALQIELALSEERESLGRDVHDLIGHSLTAVKLKAELAERLVEANPAAAQQELREIVRLTGDAIAGVRSTVTGIRSVSLPDQLQASRSVLQSAGIRVRVVGAALALSPAQSLPAAWILREATTNVLRHAQASRVEVLFAPGTLTVADNGTGRRGQSGNGLRGMAERASAAGAALVVTSTPGVGTKVTVTW